LLLTTSCASSRTATVAPVGDPRAPSEPVLAPRASGESEEPHWQDVFHDVPELFFVIRPKALREDRIYGPLLRRAIRLAREQSKVVAATRMAESVEDAEEVVLGLSHAAGRAAEAILVENGVRTDIDPAKLVDDDGGLFWTLGPSGAIRELVHGGPPKRDPEQDPDASLFELPGRTWVIATGPARDRARDVFARPLNRPLSAYTAVDDRALAFLRIDGATLVSRVQPLHGRGPLSTVGDKLVSAVLSLPPGAEHSLRAVLAYADDDAALAAESVLRETFSALGRMSTAKLAWLGNASLTRAGTSVIATAPLPPQLIDGLLGAAPNR
jgi:hypothetical protein